MISKWDYRFLYLAKHISSYSKDTSTKCGAVIVDSNNSIVSTGYNGLARGVDDSIEKYKNRDYKYSCIIHAEVNAILFAESYKLAGSTLYTYPFQPCSNCSSIIIQKGIIRCVAPEITQELESRWKRSVEIAKDQFSQVGIKLDIYPFI